MTTLKLGELSVGYGETMVLSRLTLPTIPQGNVVAVLGPNGSGKSTLMRALAGLLPFDGTALLGEKDIRGLVSGNGSRQIGYLPQSLPQPSTLVAYEAVLSTLRTVQRNIGKTQTEDAVEVVFDRLNIRHLAFSPLHTLSGGQRQMIGLAQVIVRKPGLMLLDEPTSALDLKWQLDVFDVTRDTIRQSDGLCLIALHDINLAIRHCDKIMLLGRNGLLAYGSPAEAITGATLHEAYGISGRVETCSQGRPFVIADGATSHSPTSPQISI